VKTVYTILRRLVVIAIIILWAPQARAQANPHFERGVKLLKDMEDAKALDELERALKVPETSAKERAQIHLHMGIAQSNLLKRDAARQSFRAALKLDPAIRPPELTSPKIGQIFEEVRLEVQAERKDEKPGPPVAAPPKEPAEQPTVPEASVAKERPVNWPAWITLGAAVAAGGVGIAMGALSSSAEDQANDISLTYYAAKEHHDKAQGRALAANILFGVAGAAAVASGVLFYLGWRKTERASAAVVPLDSGVLVQLRGVAW
jgi:tetratricopeptide (TPR) repeat protein